MISDVPPRYTEGLKFGRGDTIHARIMFTGRPTPKAVWTRDEKTLKSAKRLEIKSTGRHSILTVDDADRADSGLYRLTVENKLGSDSVEFSVTVIGGYYFKNSFCIV